MFKVVNHPFSFNQDYRKQDQSPSPDEWPMYTEAFSISKISIEGSKQVRIKTPLITPYFYRSKLAIENPIVLAFAFANDLESLLVNDKQKLVDAGSGVFNTLVSPNEKLPPIPDHELEPRMPYRVAYYMMPEFSDYPTNDVPNYPAYSSNRLVSQDDAQKVSRLVDMYLVQAGIIPSPLDFTYDNPEGYSYLYIWPFLPKIQQTQCAASGRFSLILEF